MPPRRELGLLVLVVLVVLLIIARIGTGRNREPSGDPRRSTYLTAPAGAHGFAAALERLGVRVVQLRQRLPRVEADALVATAERGPTVVAALGPTYALDGGDAAALARLSSAGLHLLIAGGRAEAAMRCFGYRVRPMLQAEPAISPEPRYRLDVRAVLRPGRRRAVAATPADSAQCAQPVVLQVDTLLRTEAGGEPVVLRLRLASGAVATLVADDEMFTNRVLRSEAGAPFVLRLVADHYRRLMVDEYDHGFGPSGRLDQAVVAWIRRTPWGWAGVQLGLAGLLALFTAGRRFGPVQRRLERRRRSPLEHVHALATALAAARGHELAVRLLVRGLQRRIGRRAAGPVGMERDPATWLANTAPRLRTPGGRAAASTLLGLMQEPVSRAGVLTAAELVETIWSDLTAASPPPMSSARPA
jgi:uncharacterized protein DUF4350